MAQIIDQNSENHVEETSAASDGTAPSNDVSVPQASAGIAMHSAGLPSPPPEASASLPAHLEQLAERARVYVEAASSSNTRKAYASDWKHFAAWCRRQNVAPLPPDPQVVGLYITACASGTAERGMKANTCPPSNGAFRRSAGIAPSAVCRLIVRTAPSPP
jgi:hypothetical protein